MKRKAIGSLVVILMTILISCSNPITSTPILATVTSTPIPGTPTPGPFGERVERNQITSVALANNLYGDPATRNFWVYLPPGYYETTKRYPVVYVLPWGGGTTPGFLPNLLPIMDPMIKKGEINGMILVFPDATTKIVESMYMSSPTIGDFETYITKELVNLVDSTYRTIPSRDSRGIMGCSMGGLGTMHLALKYPEVFGVAVPMNGLQMYEPFFNDVWESGRTSFPYEPKNWEDYFALGSQVCYPISIAAIAASNPNKPPFYLDMPYKIVNGKTEIDQEVFEKVKSLYVTNDINLYLKQPVRLNAFYIYTSDELGDKEYMGWAKSFDELLTDLGIQHDFIMFFGAHCTYDFTPVIDYMNSHLRFSQ